MAPSRQARIRASAAPPAKPVEGQLPQGISEAASAALEVGETSPFPASQCKWRRRAPVLHFWCFSAFCPVAGQLLIMGRCELSKTMKMPPCSESKNSQIWVLSGLIIAILATISSAYSQVLPQRDGRTPPHPSPGSGQLGPRNACSFPGADAGEQIMSAIKDLPEEGGIVDA